MAYDDSDFSQRVYRLLLYLYPAEFRREYGESMARTFKDMQRDQLAGLWRIVLGDLITSAAHEHIAHFARRNLMERRTWIALIGGLLLASAVGWVDQHASEVQATLIVLLPAGFVLGALQPKHAWRWAVTLWLGIAVAGTIALLIGWEGPAVQHSREVTGQPLPQSFLNVLQSVIALVPALISTYMGAGMSLLIGMLRRRESDGRGAPA
jgi:hypothetical protein